MVAVAVMTAMNVNAQNGYDETKHEVAISFGALSNSQIIDVFENIGGALVGSKFENETFIGPISAEYFYHVKNWLGTLRNEKYDSDDASYEDDSNSEVHVNWQISLLGIEAGGSTIRGFLELGTGEQGIALIGVRYKF